jgi:hypothetical protein
MIAAVTSAHAQTLMVQGTGSSGVWQAFGVATFNDVAGGAGSAHIFTIKGSCPDANNCAQIHDGRSSQIPNQSGTLYIIWNSNASQVWTYLNVDTVIGNRAFFGGAQLQLDNCLKTSVGGCPGQQLIPKSVIGNQVDDTTVPDAVWNVVNNQKFNALFSELRPEDALAEQKRTVNVLTSTLSGLGYGTGASTLIGTPIQSAFDSATAVPVSFAILPTAKDPFTHVLIPAWSSVEVGAFPVVWVENRSNGNGLGAVSGGKYVYTDLSDKHSLTASLNYRIQALYNGNCTSSEINPTIPAPFSAVPVNLMLREPLSGTMTTAEYTEFRNKGNTTRSQEAGVGQPTSNTSANPLNKACTSGGGTKQRGIGTGEVLKGNGKGVGGVLNVSDSLAYAFWSFGNFAPFGLNPTKYGYLTLDGVDPLQTTYTDGSIPTCTAPCGVPPNTSFPHLRDGTYRSYTIVRAISFGTSVDPNLQNLVTNAQNDVDSIEPDFVSFVATPNGDTGLGHYRSHFVASGVTTPSNVNDKGGDVGGVIFPNPPVDDLAHLGKKQ